MTINWEKYSAVAFIDSNVALECLALEQLPWREIEKTGSILLLIMPTVVQEIDSKKNHARLGDHARRFNKTLRPLLTTGNDTVVIRSSPAPQVEVALADCDPIDWGDFPSFDRDEADARVAVQAKCASCHGVENRIVISHDIRPLYLAQQLGMRVHQIGDNWLRPKEISEAEKKATSLQRELNSLKSREPKLEVSFGGCASSIDTFSVRNLSNEERMDIKRKIVSLNPMPKQERSHSFLHSPLDHDSSLDSRYQKWEEKIIPNFIQEYERKIELNFGQVEIRFCLKNAGQVPAEGVLIRFLASGGWLNDRYVLASPYGPNAPRPRKNNLGALQGIRSKTWPKPQPGKHEFVVIEEPQRTTQVQVSCQDFRHGYEYEYSVIAWVDPHSDGLAVEVTVTASNLHGDVRERIQIVPIAKEVAVSEIIDMEKMTFCKPPPLANLWKQVLDKNDYSLFEFDDSNWDS